MAFRSKLCPVGRGLNYCLRGRHIIRCLVSVRKCSMKSSDPSDPKTHTGQEFEKDDYRLSRFKGKPKEINERFAINLIADTPPEEKKSRVVWCDGGGGPIGHPRVFINLDQPGNHSCGYCGLRFYKDEHHH